MWSRRRRLSATGRPERDRDLVRLHWRPELRPAFDALFAIDDAMAEVVRSASQPALAAIKLAWWREALERLDAESAPAEPRLQAAAAELLSRGVSGEHLAGLEQGWAAVLQPEPDKRLVETRGERLFALAGRLLGSDQDVGEAGRLWSGVDLARRLGRALPPPRDFPPAETRVRPLTMLAALARRDAARGLPLESEATPARSWTILKHRLTGR